MKSIKISIKKPYVSKEGKFRISLTNTSNKYIWKFEEGEIRLKYFDIAHYIEALDNKSFRKVVERFSFDTMVSLKGKELEKLFKLDEQNRIATTYFEFDDGSFGIQKYQLLGKRFYVILATFNDKTDEDLFTNVLDSFEVTGRANSQRIFSKITKEITPDPLPQNPVIPNEKNDLIEANLKGKVKEVKKYLQPGDLEKPNGKYLRNIYEYDRRGYLVKDTGAIYFSNLYSIKAYGFIDGKRVYNVKYKFYYLSLFPRKEDRKEETNPEKYLKPEYDSRYVTAIEKKYKNGRLRQRIFYNSAGRITYRRSFEYKDDKVIAIGYDFNGNMIMKTISTLNENGDFISQIRIDRGSTPPITKYYKYEYDKNENWVKKIVSFDNNFDDLNSRKRYIWAREITYF